MSGSGTFEAPQGLSLRARGYPSEHIAVGVDGSLSSRAAVRWALAHAHSGDLVELVHTFEPSPADSSSSAPVDDEGVARRLAARELNHARALATDPTVELRATTIAGPARERLAEVPADLLVIGADAPRGIREHFFGSVCRHLAKHVARPLVIVPCPTEPRTFDDAPDWM